MAAAVAVATAAPVQDRQAVAGIVREYLACEGFTAALAAFDGECATRKLLVKPSTPKSDRVGKAQESKVKNEMLSALRGGDSDTFTQLWIKHIPEIVQKQDPICAKMEFYTHMLFAIQPIHPYIANKSHFKEANTAMGDFRLFLERKGAVMCSMSEFLPYFALPFVPNPEKHPSFLAIFTAQWVADLESRLGLFLDGALTTSPLPRIYYLFNNVSSSQPTNKPADIGFIAALEKQIADCEERELKYIDRFTRMQKEYHTLVGIAAELVEAMERTVRGQPITSSYLHSVCSRLASFSTHPAGSLSADFGTAEQGFDTIDSVPLPLLDLNKIHHDLLTLTDRNAAVLLQALRWRITQSMEGAQRDGVVAAYLSADLFQLANPSSEQCLLRIASSPSELVREQFAILCNTLACLSAGRSYFLQNDATLRVITATMMAEPGDTSIRQQLLSTLQRLSLRKRAQLTLIASDVLPWILQQLSASDELSEYSIEYLAALLMNLTLRTRGKVSCAKQPSDVIGCLSNLLEHENFQVRTYVHGALYSLLSHPVILRAARATGLQEVLAAQLQVSDATLRRQLEYLLQLLAQDAAPFDENSSSDDDDEDEEDEGDLPLDYMENETLTAVGPAGEQLLALEYLSVAHPDVVSQHRPTTGHQGLTDQDPFALRPTTPRVHRPTTSSNNEARQQQQQQQQQPPPNTASSQNGRPRTSRAAGSRPSTAVDRPVTAAGTLPTASHPTPRVVAPSKKAIEALGAPGAAKVDEYQNAFASRGKILRTPPNG